mmetsp:Transcript_10890/g.35968  ORF Transcript_10890/g.35968 Transcript_10890/m.35968 type:complete len:222 (+) Transcript_10890:371-1036(+)
MSKKTHPFTESLASGTATSNDPTMNFLPVPTPPSVYPRTELVPPMENASYGGRSPMTLPPFAATVSRAPRPNRKSRCARTIKRLNASISGRTGTACSALTTNCASSRPRPSYTNRIIMFTEVSCFSPENVNGLPYASRKMGCFKSSCSIARWYVALNVPVHEGARGRRYSTPEVILFTKTPRGPSPATVPSPLPLTPVETSLDPLPCASWSSSSRASSLFA